jgi:hypothetical protein
VYRILPALALQQISAAVVELQGERFAPAVELFAAGRDAFDARPRRERDVCSNMFDAMESVAKEVYKKPNSTFGQVVSHIPATSTMNPQITGALSALNDLRNKTFGHGMTTPFNLSPDEVDFTYLGCLSGVLLLTRLAREQNL